MQSYQRHLQSSNDLRSHALYLFTLSMDVFTDPSTWLAGPEDSSGNAADGADYEGSEAAPDAEMMKSESLSTAAAAAIAARAAAAARLREEEQKRRVLEEEAVGEHPFNAMLCPAHSHSAQAELFSLPQKVWGWMSSSGDVELEVWRCGRWSSETRSRLLQTCLTPWRQP